MKIVSNKPTITRKELEGVLDCLIHAEINTGGSVKSFESAISDIIGLKYPLAVNSITSAYILIFKSLEIGADDELIIPSIMNQAPLSALHITGGKPVIIDSENNSIYPSIEQIKNAITEKTKTIVLCDIFGYHFDTTALADINIPVIIDVSHTIGTEYNGSYAGSQGTFAVASFAPSMIITTGNGGIVLTNNSRYFSSMRELRGYKEDSINYDFTLTDIQAAMGISQLIKLKDFLKRRREIAKKYHESIRITPHKTLFPYSEDAAYQTFPVLFDAPIDRVEKYWKKNGIEIVKAIPAPLHSISGLKGFDFPNSERISKKLFSIPLYPTLTKMEIEKISKTLASFI